MREIEDGLPRCRHEGRRHRGEHSQDTWLRVAGTVITGSSMAASSFVSTMKVTTATKIDHPANIYAY
jgi:uncharacterized membrane protein YcgQ (UPF0703/DUF1980 family)